MSTEIELVCITNPLCGLGYSSASGSHHLSDFYTVSLDETTSFSQLHISFPLLFKTGESIALVNATENRRT